MEQSRLQVFADRFRELRGEKTQGEFAEFLGISRPTVGFYENGTRLPDVLVLRQIAEKCQVSADWLIGMSNTKSFNGQLTQVCQYTGLSEKSIDRLHYLATLNEYPKPYLKLIEKLLGPPILHFRDYAYRTALLEVQAKRSTPQTPKAQEDIAHYYKERNQRLLEDACKEMGGEAWKSEITVWDASKVNRDRAERAIRSAASETIGEYIEEVGALIAEMMREQQENPHDTDAEM